MVAKQALTLTVGVRLPHPQPILPFSLIGKTPVSEAGFLGSSPGGAAKSKSNVDGTANKTLKTSKVGLEAAIL